MAVRLAQLGATFEDLGVDAVALQQSLAHAERLKAADGLLEVAVGRFVLPVDVGDPPQPDMRLRDVGALFQALGQLEGLLRAFAGLLHLAFFHRQLAQAQQRVAAAGLEGAFVPQLERSLAMVARPHEVSRRQQVARAAPRTDDTRAGCDEAVPAWARTKRMRARRNAVAPRSSKDVPSAMASWSCPAATRASSSISRADASSAATTGSARKNSSALPV